MFLMLKHCDFEPSYSSYVNGILSTDCTSLKSFLTGLFISHKELFHVTLCPHDSFISLGHILALIAVDRDFLERKQENKDTKVAAWGEGNC
jgi:hypothetical protein